MRDKCLVMHLALYYSFLFVIYKKTIDKNGFTAEWNFNQANLPFSITSFTDQLKAKNIDFGVFPITVHHRCKKRVAPLLFNLAVIALRIALFHGASARNRFGFVQHGFGECGFTTPGVAHKDHVPDLFGVKGRHR